MQTSLLGREAPILQLNKCLYMCDVYACLGTRAHVCLYEFGTRTRIFAIDVLVFTCL